MNVNKVFSSPDHKGHTSYCNHFVPVTVVFKIFTFKFPSPKSFVQLEPNLVGMYIGGSPLKLMSFFSIRNKQKEQEAQSAKRVFCFLYVEHLFFYFVTDFVTVPDIHQHLPSSSLPLVKFRVCESEEKSMLL